MIAVIQIMTINLILARRLYWAANVQTATAFPT